MSAKPIQGSISEEVNAFLSHHADSRPNFTKFEMQGNQLKIQVSPTRGVLKRPATDPEIPTTKVGL